MRKDMYHETRAMFTLYLIGSVSKVAPVQCEQEQELTLLATGWGF